METPVDLTPVFIEPRVAVYFCPTSGKEEQKPGGGFDVCCDRPDLHVAKVGGLTGEQLSLFRRIQAENHCWYEVFPVSPKGPAEYCIEPREPWSSYCEEHAFSVAQEQPYYDEYDSHRDLEFES